MSNSNQQMAEFAENLWQNYIKQKMTGELENTMSYYRAVVTEAYNSTTKTIKVQRPYDTEVSVHCKNTMKNATVGTEVIVTCYGTGNSRNQVVVGYGNGDEPAGDLSAYRTAAEQDVIDATKISVSDLLSKVYPVGSIYMSVNPTSPQSFLGGTWTRIKDTFLLAGGTSYSPGTTGGEAAHTLTESELPSHRHNLPNNGHAWYWGQTSGTNIVHGYGNVAAGGATGNEMTTHQGIDNKTEYTGSGAAHNNMPPYLTVYMWKRTA